MLKIFDYRCTSTQEVFERLNKNSNDIQCNCGSVAVRMISPVKCKLDNSFPGYADKWARDHEVGGKGKKVK